MKTIRHTGEEKKHRIFSLNNDIYKDENKAYKDKAKAEMRRSPYTTQRTKP